MKQFGTAKITSPFFLPASKGSQEPLLFGQMRKLAIPIQSSCRISVSFPSFFPSRPLLYLNQSKILGDRTWVKKAFSLGFDIKLTAYVSCLLAKIPTLGLALSSTFTDAYAWYSPPLKIEQNVSFRSELCFIPKSLLLLSVILKRHLIVDIQSGNDGESGIQEKYTENHKILPIIPLPKLGLRLPSILIVKCQPWLQNCLPKIRDK